MVVILPNQFLQLLAGIGDQCGRWIDVVAVRPGRDNRDLVPQDQAITIGQFMDHLPMLVMGQPDCVGTHFADRADGRGDCRRAHRPITAFLILDRKSVV